MERTQTLPASGASPFQLHIPSDDVHDVRTIADIVNLFAWQQRQMKTRAPEKAARRISSQLGRVKWRWAGKVTCCIHSLYHVVTSVENTEGRGENAETAGATDRVFSDSVLLGCRFFFAGREDLFRNARTSFRFLRLCELPSHLCVLSGRRLTRRIPSHGLRSQGCATDQRRSEEPARPGAA